MPKNTVPPPELTPDDIVLWSERHTPPMESGDYTLTVEQTFQAGADDTAIVSTAKLDFEVRGERYSLADGEIHAVFPPAGSSGKYSEALPHIALNRSTLPWERQPRSDVDVRDTDTPWLALVVLDEAEQAQVVDHVVVLSHLTDGAPPPQPRGTGSEAPASGYPARLPTPSPEQAQHATDQVRVIDIPSSLLRRVLPRAADLPATAHVRTAHGPHGTAATTTSGGTLAPELAMVVANRLPGLGSCTVHLVSIEHRYRTPAANSDAHPPREAITDPAPRTPISVGPAMATLLATGRAHTRTAGQRIDITVSEDMPTTISVRPGPDAAGNRGEAPEPDARDEIGDSLGGDAIEQLVHELLAADADLHDVHAQTGRVQFRPRLTAPDGADLGRVEVTIRQSSQRVADTAQARAAHADRPHGSEVTVPKVTTVRFRLLDDEAVFDMAGATGDDRVRLVALRSWSFTCEPENGGFVDELTSLNHGGTSSAAFHVPLDNLDAAVTDPTDPVARGRDRLRTGAVALPHNLRGGGRTVSFYRGPFLSDAVAEVPLNLPVGGPDELLVYDDQLGMWNVDLAVAWQLGRLMSLEDREHSTRLLRWKRRHARSLAHARQAVDHDELPLHPDAPDAVLPPDIAAWFRALTLLRDVPFNHLVPDERMLPPESLRWFDVDSSWIGALRDGAFSVGRVLPKDQADDAVRAHHLPEPPQLSGLLIRSRVVRDWQRLVVDGWTRVRGDDYSLGRDPVPNADRLQLERMDRLGPNVLLCLFSDPTRHQGRLELVDVHLPAEILHHGVEIADEQLVKELRSPTDGERLGTNVVMPIRSDGERVIDLATLADRVDARLRPTLQRAATTADLALQLLDTPPMVRFHRKLGATDA